MKFNLLELINFRQYKEAKFEFKDGINILQGDNGVGKSTLMASIIFALYGKEIMLESELIKNEKDFSLANIDNIEIIGESKKYRNSKTIVKLKIELNNKTEYMIKREYDSETNEEKLDILESNIKEGNVKKEVTFEEIEKRLPEEIAPLLFFDGERIKKIEQVMGSKTSDAFKEEIEKILKVEELNGGRRLLNRVSKDITNSIDNEELQSIEQNIDKNKSVLNLKKEELEKLEERESNLKKEETELKFFFKERQESEEKIKQIEAKETELGLIEEMLNSKEKGLQRNLILNNSSKVNILLFENILVKIKSGKEIYEISGIEQRAIDDILQKDYCICGNFLSEEVREKLVKVRETLPPESFQAVLTSALKSKMKVEEDEQQQKIDLKEYNKKLKEKIEIENNINILKNQIPEGNSLNVQEKRNRYSQISDIIKNILELKGGIKRDIDLLQNQIKKEESNKEKILKKIQKYEEEKIGLDLIKDAKDILENRIKKRKEKIKEDLQTFFNMHLKDLLRDGVEVEIDDRLKPGTPVFKNKTTADSTGQGVLISLSYLFALIDVAKVDNLDNILEVDNEEFPIVLDGVTATLDADHTKRVMDKLKKHQGQTIILSNSAMINLIMKNFDPKERIITITREVDATETKVGEKYGI